MSGGDLRQRVAKALHDRQAGASHACAIDSSWHPYFADADAALAVFAAWLRERAEAAGMQYRAEAELRRLADELDPPKGD